jgi:hypothetical protein
VHLVQLLLPTRDRQGQPIPAAKAADTRTELVEKFGGVTAYLRAAASGAWINDAGVLERDELVMVEVVVDDFDREWWQSYATRLAQRFDQDEMHIRALPLQIVSKSATIAPL